MQFRGCGLRIDPSVDFDPQESSDPPIAACGVVCVFAQRATDRILCAPARLPPTHLYARNHSPPSVRRQWPPATQRENTRPRAFQPRRAHSGVSIWGDLSLPNRPFPRLSTPTVREYATIRHNLSSWRRNV